MFRRFTKHTSATCRQTDAARFMNEIPKQLISINAAELMSNSNVATRSRYRYIYILEFVIRLATLQPLVGFAMSDTELARDTCRVVRSIDQIKTAQTEPCSYSPISGRVLFVVAGLADDVRLSSTRPRR